MTEMMGDDYLGALDDLLGDDYLGDDYLGDDYLGEADILGALARGRRPVRRGSRGGAAVQRMRAAARGRMLTAGSRPLLGTPLGAPPPWRQAQAAPGVQRPTEQQLVAGFTGDGGNQFSSTSPLSRVFRSLPQKPFRGERMVWDVARVGASTAGILIGVDSIKVGVDEQIVSADPIPLSLFTAGAFDTRLALTAAQPGIIIAMRITLSAAPAAGDTITLVGSLIGKSIL